MENKMFSFYDFLGYLFPGAFLTIVTISIFSLENIIYNCNDLRKIFYVIKEIDIEKILVLVVIMYVLGHLLSFISAITVERYSIWTLNYPSKYLLRYKKRAYFQVKGNKMFRIPARVINFLFLFLLTSWDLVLSHSPLKMSKLVVKPLEKETQCALRRCICKNLKEKYKISNFCHKEDFNFLEILYHEVVENSEKHFLKAQNYVALYGFARTITLILNISTYVLSWKIITLKMYNKIGYISIILLSFSSFLMYCAYNKFSRKYTLEILMAYLVINKSTSFNNSCNERCKTSFIKK